MSTPAIIYLILSGMGLLIAANKHGKPKEGNENFWYTFISVCIVWPLLWWGGFFS